MKEFTIVVCPTCEEYELPSGAFRARCRGCGQYFSRDDEIPDCDFNGYWWSRNKWSYPMQGKKIKVTTVE